MNKEEFSEDVKELLKTCIVARHALRSYEHGNTSIAIAVEVADRIDSVIEEFPQNLVFELQADMH